MINSLFKKMKLSQIEIGSKKLKKTKVYKAHWLGASLHSLIKTSLLMPNWQQIVSKIQICSLILVSHQIRSMRGFKTRFLQSGIICILTLSVQGSARESVIMKRCFRRPSVFPNQKVLNHVTKVIRIMKDLI